MKSKGKYIGVESRVPFDVLETAIVDYMQNGCLDKMKCLNHIKKFNAGENRALKILKHINVIIGKNEQLLIFFKKTMKGLDFYQLGKSERTVFLLCLFVKSFPISYDIMSAMAQGFKVQDKINKQVIIQKIGAAYGGSRAMDIAITETIPFLIECGVIKRMKLGIYALDSMLSIRNKFLTELIVYIDIFLSGSKSILIDDLSFKPWYSYFDISSINPELFNLLISKKDSAVGKGYLTI